MSSLYWDDFNKRLKETVQSLQNNQQPQIRRVCIFITDRCNFRCKYCNMDFGKNYLSYEKFDNIVNKYGDSAIIHITGGEPLCVPYLKDYIDNASNKIKFHLNSNLYFEPPKNIKRLKVSLDSSDTDTFDNLVKIKGAFKKVTKNIKVACDNTKVSITYVLSKATYKQAPQFMRWARKEFGNLYAVFFSCYKGKDKDFVFNKKEIEDFFVNIKPKLENEMDKESLNLLHETIDEKFRLIQGVRFPENQIGKCYLSMSERVYDFNGNIYNCSHLYRDKINHTNNSKYSLCKYGCNRRLVKFNQDAEKMLVLN